MAYKLAGYDTFSSEWYPFGEYMRDNGTTIDGMKPSYETHDEALADARQRLADLEKTQPASSSGGQGFSGIQDRVYIVHPDGHKERIFS